MPPPGIFAILKYAEGMLKKKRRRERYKWKSKSAEVEAIKTKEKHIFCHSILTAITELRGGGRVVERVLWWVDVV